jgi:hypothetical protein
MFTGGTNHFEHAGSPADKVRAADYEDGPYVAFGDGVLKGFTSIAPTDADVSAVADAIVSAHRYEPGRGRGGQRGFRPRPR